ncbi:hypothetical protein BST96_20180 [Oceanicoccus sagamiensis]|uniref:Porin domain-containing protein n=1 Tax=Oceanicoccus sagamiensis TaxID=716816 RepID=A0A1X9NFB1_9GAMM|nr:hypothetical protein BST96_20180 [Oceanicoccus sagamiensis]
MSLAYTDAEIDQMFKALQAENDALKEEIKQLKQESEATIQEQLVPARQNNQTQISSVKRSLEKQQSALKINGFLTAGASKADPAVYDQNIDISDDITFDTDTIVGLQTSFQLSPKSDVTVQMVARAADNWELEAEWAFLRYNLTDDLSFRAGRLRLPLYLFSESLDVGFSYPWVRPPNEVYALPIKNYEGIDLLYTASTGDWIHQLQVFAGNDNDDNFDTSNFFGGNITSSSGPWTYRISAFKFDIEFSKFAGFEPTENIEDGGTYYTLAGMYDDGNWLAITEISTYKTDQTTVFRDTDSGYVTLGKHMGKFMPHFTYGKSYTTNEPKDDPVDILLGQFINFTGTSYAAGLRYNLTENTSAKLEWTHYTDMDGTGGIWNGLRFDELNGSSGPEDIDNIDIYSIVLDVVF